MNIVFKVLLVLLIIIAWWTLLEEKPSNTNEFTIYYSGVDGTEVVEFGFILNVEGSKYVIKRPFTGGIKYSTQYMVSEQHYWVDSKLIEWSHSDDEKYKEHFVYESSGAGIFETAVVFQLEVNRHIGKWLEEPDEYMSKLHHIQVESEYSELDKYSGEFASFYYSDNKNKKYKNKYLIISCSLKKKTSGLKPCRFNVGIGDYVNVRVMFYPERMVGWGEFMREVDRVLNSIHYIEK